MSHHSSKSEHVEQPGAEALDRITLNQSERTGTPTVTPAESTHAYWERRLRRLGAFGGLAAIGGFMIFFCKGNKLRRGDLPMDQVGYVFVGAAVLLALLDCLGIELFRKEI